MRIFRSAFSMIELVIATLILAILASAAAPKFLDSFHKRRVAAAAARIRTDLAYARQSAVSRSTTQTVVFQVSSESYTLSGLANLDRAELAYAVDLSQPPYQVDLVSASFGSGSTLQFDLHGQPDHGGTILVESSGFQETVTVDAATGRATIP